MGGWTDLLNDPRTVRAIFPDLSPSLRGIELHEVVASRDGPDVVLRFDLPEFPEDPPRKWKEAKFNRVQLSLRASVVHTLHLRGMTTPTLDLDVDREGNLICLRGAGDGVLIEVAAEFQLVTSDSVSAYLDGGVD